MAEIIKLVDCRNNLGEGPLWDAQDELLYWIDGTAGEILCCRADGSQLQRYFVPSEIGSLAICKGGGAVVALTNGFSLYDFTTQKMTHIIDPEPDEPNNRPNDGKVDRNGRFFVGYMSFSYDQAYVNRSITPIRNSALYRLDPDLSVHKLEKDIICANGLCWSPDNKIFYFSDSGDKVMYAYDFAIETGDISNRRIIQTADAYPWTFDGSTTDSEGCIWNAHVFGGKLGRYRPDGTLDRLVDFPIRNVTSLIFGGKNLDVLYVTSMARPQRGVPPTEADAGALFAVRGLGVQGIAEPRFGG